MEDLPVNGVFCSVMPIHFYPTTHRNQGLTSHATSDLFALTRHFGLLPGRRVERPNAARAFHAKQACRELMPSRATREGIDDPIAVALNELFAVGIVRVGAAKVAGPGRTSH